MGYFQSSSTSNVVSSHLYSQALQMKLYQAFIFSIPILFSIILFLLFYLFYLKTKFSRNNSSTSSSIVHPRTQDSSTLSQCGEITKVNLEDKLIVISFDQDLYAKDSMCCVCLGEFEINEMLHQIPSCQHMFHGDCIRNWLNSNTTCPLCRCSVVTASKGSHREPLVVPEPPTVINVGSNSEQVPFEHSVAIFEGSSSSSMDHKLSHSNEEFVVNVQIHDS